MDGQRILLIEDCQGDALRFEIMMRRRSAENTIHHVETLEDALDWLGQTEPPVDIIVSDLRLPGVEGYEGVSALKQIAPELPMVILTGSEDRRILQDVIQLGVQDFINKNDLTPSVIGNALEFARRRSELEQSLRAQSQTDDLTGLLNRRGLEEQLHSHHSQPHALLFMDLDRFKPVNDLHGHAMGDVLLKKVAQRLQASLRKGDQIARLGGDEFAVLLPGVRVQEDADTVARILEQRLSQPYALREDLTVSIGASAGAVLAQPGESIEALMERADAAMYVVKREHKRAPAPAAATEATAPLAVAPMLALPTGARIGSEVTLPSPDERDTFALLRLLPRTLREARPDEVLMVRLETRLLGIPDVAAEVSGLLSQRQRAPATLRLALSGWSAAPPQARVGASRIAALGVELLVDDLDESTGALTVLLDPILSGAVLCPTLLQRALSDAHARQVMLAMSRTFRDIGWRLIARSADSPPMRALCAEMGITVDVLSPAVGDVPASSVA